MTPTLHPWLATPEALEAARKAVQVPMSLMAGKALLVGADELLSEALAILTECALPPREVVRVLCAKCQEPLEGVRSGAKFCSANCRKQYAVQRGRGKVEVLPARTGAHIGSMWKWPEDERAKFAIREVGYCLNNYLRSRHYGVETSVTFDRGSEFRESKGGLYHQYVEDSPEEFIANYLEQRGLQVLGDESFEELCQAAMFARGLPEPVRTFGEPEVIAA